MPIDQGIVLFREDEEGGISKTEEGIGFRERIFRKVNAASQASLVPLASGQKHQGPLEILDGGAHPEAGPAGEAFCYALNLDQGKVSYLPFEKLSGKLNPATVEQYATWFKNEVQAFLDQIASYPLVGCSPEEFVGLMKAILRYVAEAHAASLPIESLVGKQTDSVREDEESMALHADVSTSFFLCGQRIAEATSYYRDGIPIPVDIAEWDEAALMQAFRTLELQLTPSITIETVRVKKEIAGTVNGKLLPAAKSIS